MYIIAEKRYKVNKYLHLGKMQESFIQRLKHVGFLIREIVSKVDFLLRLLENPNLLEHESFTDLLWAVLHLEEELSYRKTLKELPNSDYAHLSGDIKRAYGLVISEWLTYVKHLKYNYPYLFSLAIRMNPLNKDASPLVK